MLCVVLLAGVLCGQAQARSVSFRAPHTTACSRSAAPTVSHAARLTFATAGARLGGARAARLRIGSRLIALRVGRLATVRRVRRIAVVGLRGSCTHLRHARLTVELRGHGRTAAAISSSLALLTAEIVLSPMSTTPRTAAGGAQPVMGVNVGSAIAWELPFAQQLGARNVRMNFAISTPTSQMDSIIGAYAKAGIRPELLATFDGSIPSSADIANLGAWARRYGPGGTFWAQSGYPASLAVTRIEFGNETSGFWEYSNLASASNWWGTSAYSRIAERYGQAYVSAVSAVKAADPGVKVLAVADSPGQVPQWLDGMFKGAPSLARVVQGWVVHPYGSDWRADIDKTLAQAQSLGASDDVPVYATEVGVASDQGNCLDANYGWNPCMSYQQAADTLASQVQDIKADLGSRLAELDIYSARDINATGTTTDMDGYFGALQSDGQPKGAYTTAVQNLLATTGS